MRRLLPFLLLLCACSAQGGPAAPEYALRPTGLIVWRNPGVGDQAFNSAGPVTIDGGCITFTDAETGTRVSLAGSWRYHSWSAE